MKHKNLGFTIVELLIVIVVIGILAAISIVAYNGISNQANDSAVKNDLANNAKKIEMYRTTATDGLYPTSFTALTGSDKLKFSKSSYITSTNAALYCQDSGRTTFALFGRSKSGKMYVVTHNTSVREMTGAESHVSICPNNRAWIHDINNSVPGNWHPGVD